jgi:hypothetical protein
VLVAPVLLKLQHSVVAQCHLKSQIFICILNPNLLLHITLYSFSLFITFVRTSNLIYKFFGCRTHGFNITNNKEFKFNIIIHINYISCTPPDSKTK